VDLQLSASRSVRGQTATVLSADLSSVPVPAKRYSADVAFVGYDRETVKILFGQEKFGAGGRLRTLLIIKMTPAAVMRHLEQVDGAEPSFPSVAERIGVIAEDLPQFANEPRETVTFDANMILAAFTGREACSDFYHASPFSVSVGRESKKLALDPVVRVDMRTSLMFGVIAALRKLMDELPAELKEEI
jgi:hypothetical protein